VNLKFDYKYFWLKQLDKILAIIALVLAYAYVPYIDEGPNYADGVKSLFILILLVIFVPITIFKIVSLSCKPKSITIKFSDEFLLLNDIKIKTNSISKVWVRQKKQTDAPLICINYGMSFYEINPWYLSNKSDFAYEKFETYCNEHNIFFDVDRT